MARKFIDWLREYYLYEGLCFVEFTYDLLHYYAEKGSYACV